MLIKTQSSFLLHIICALMLLKLFSKAPETRECFSRRSQGLSDLFKDHQRFVNGVSMFIINSSLSGAIFLRKKARM